MIVVANSEEHSMRADPYQLIESALEPGETLLWTGRQFSRPQQPKASFNVVFFLGVSFYVPTKFEYTTPR